MTKVTEDEVRTPVVYISAPGYNNPQRVGVEKIIEVMEGAGYKVALPTVSAEIPPVPEAQACLSALQNADLVVAWLDNLSPEGISVYTVGGIQTELTINLPPQIVEMMQAGALLMQKKGVNFKKKKGRAIVLPHEMNKPPEVPTTIGMNFEKQGGQALCALVGQPMNLSDASTVFELGYAFAARKPVIALALVNPEIGMYLGWTPQTVVSSFEKLGVVAKEYFADAMGPYKKQTEKLAALQKEHGYPLHDAWRARLPKATVSDPMDLSDIIPKEEGDKQDGGGGKPS